MTPVDVQASSEERRQQFCARVAGFLFLWLIVTGISNLLIESNVAGSGAFAETARRIAASEHLYRLGLLCGLIETMSALTLAFALYVTLKPVDPLLAQFAMLWRVGESFLGAVGVMLGFFKLQLYTSTQPGDGFGAGQMGALADLLGHGGSDISAIFFSIGSILFFYLFLKSRYIPKILSAFGLFASIVVAIMLFGLLIFPEHARTLQYGWAPMALAEVTTGIWLMGFGVKTQTA